MCPPPASPIAINLWTDEALIVLLEDIIHGHPLPSNVIADINPYNYLPSYLPGGIGYFISSEVKKDTELGSWKAKGDPCQIFTNSDKSGWRISLEFCEGQAPYERRTDWVMQEYRITQTGLCTNSNIKNSGTLCRLFRNEEQIPDHVIHSKNGGSLPRADSNTGQGSTSEAKEKNGDDETGPPLSVAERRKCVLNGDFLELDDLADPQSPSSSSDNSSCPTFTSDEWFDSVELLRDLEDENIGQQGKDASYKYTVSTSVKPNEVVMCPATLGKLSGGGSQKSGYSLPDSAAIERNIDNRVLIQAINCSNEIAYAYQNAAASGSQYAASNQVKEKERKNGVHRMKKLKKYFCLIPL